MFLCKKKKIFSNTSDITKTSAHKAKNEGHQLIFYSLTVLPAHIPAKLLNVTAKCNKACTLYIYFTYKVMAIMYQTVIRLSHY